MTRRRQWTLAVWILGAAGCGGTIRDGSAGDEDPGDEFRDGGGVTESGGRPPIGAGGRTGRGSAGRAPVGMGGAPGSGGRGAGGRFGTGGVGFPDAGPASGGREPFDAGAGGRVFDAGSDPGRNRVRPGQVCDRLSTIQCAGEAYCCPSLQRPQGDCKVATMGACYSLDEVSVVPVIAYDVDVAEEVFTEFERRASECDPDIVTWAVSNGGFRRIARGTIPIGEVCASVNSSGADILAHFGSCQNPETTSCVPNFTTRTWNCVARSAHGGPCFTDIDCEDGLGCNPPISQGGGLCTDRFPNGAACVYGWQCRSFTCREAGCVAATTETAYCPWP